MKVEATIAHRRRRKSSWCYGAWAIRQASGWCGTARIERVAGVAQLVRHSDEAGAIVLARTHAAVFVNHAVDARPVVPGEAASEPDRGLGAREALGTLHPVFPGVVELDHIETTVPSCEGDAFHVQCLLHQIRMVRGEPEKLPCLTGGAVEARTFDGHHARSEHFGDCLDAVMALPAKQL